MIRALVHGAGRMAGRVLAKMPEFENYEFILSNQVNIYEIFNENLVWELPKDLIIGNYKILATLKINLTNTTIVLEEVEELAS